MLSLTRFGGYSDVVVAPEAAVLPIPDDMPFEHGAALPVVYLTAHHMLVHLGNVKRGDTVLVHAAAGGVGLAALQLAKRAGAKTIGTASAGKHAFLAEAPHDHPIDYRTRDFEAEVRRLTGGRGVDLALAAQGGASLKKSYRCLAPAGRLFAFGVSGLAPDGERDLAALVTGVLAMPLFHPIPLMNQNRGVFGVNMGHLFGEVAMLVPQVVSLLSMYREGTIRPVIDSVFPFERAPDAHRRLLERKNVGKVLLVP